MKARVEVRHTYDVYHTVALHAMYARVHRALINRYVHSYCTVALKCNVYDTVHRALTAYSINRYTHTTRIGTVDSLFQNRSYYSRDAQKDNSKIKCSPDRKSLIIFILVTS